MIIEPKNVRLILELLNDPNIEVRKETIRVLGNIGTRKAIKPLLDLLKKRDIKIRNVARNALFKIFKKSRNFEILYEVIKGRNLISRKEAIKLVGMLNDENAINLLIKIFNSKVASLRRSAYKAILKIAKQLGIK